MNLVDVIAVILTITALGFFGWAFIWMWLDLHPGKRMWILGRAAAERYEEDRRAMQALALPYKIQRLEGWLDRPIETPEVASPALFRLPEEANS